MSTCTGSALCHLASWRLRVVAFTLHTLVPTNMEIRQPHCGSIPLAAVACSRATRGSRKGAKGHNSGRCKTISDTLRSSARSAPLRWVLLPLLAKRPLLVAVSCSWPTRGSRKGAETQRAMILDAAKQYPMPCAPLRAPRLCVGSCFPCLPSVSSLSRFPVHGRQESHAEAQRRKGP